MEVAELTPETYYAVVVDSRSPNRYSVLFHNTLSGKTRKTIQGGTAMKIFLIAWLCAGGVSVFLFWLAGRKTKTRPTIARIIAHVLAIMGGVVYLIVAVVVLLRSRDEAIIL